MNSMSLPRRKARRDLYFTALMLLVAAGCRHSQQLALEDPWYALSVRGQWEVRQTEDGVYHAWFVRRVLADRLYLTISETALERQWATWLNDGSPEAPRRLTYIVDKDSGTILHRYDYLSESILPGEGRLLREGRRVAGGSGITAPGRLPIELRPAAPGFWAGFISSFQDVHTEVCPATFGLSLTRVGAHSLAEALGMQAGDIIVKMTPWDYNDPVFKSSSDFGQAMRDRYLPGDQVEVEYLRGDDEQGWQLFRKSGVLPAYPTYDREASAAMLAFEAPWQQAAAASETAGLVALMAEQTARSDDNADLMKRLAETHKIMDAFRLAPMTTAHKYPYSMEAVGRYCSQPLLQRTELADLDWLYRLYLLEPPSRDLPEFSGGDLEAHLDYMVQLLDLAQQQRQAALSRFSTDDLAFIEAQMPHLLDGFTEARMMCFDGNLARQKSNIDLLLLMRKLEMAPLIRQFEILARLIRPAFLSSLREQLAASPQADGATIAQRQTEWGQILLSGRACNRYLKGQTAAIVVDLGGDDFYANNAGSSVPGEIPSALVIDFDGNDRYENWREMRQGCGWLGAGLLYDAAGDDTYIGTRACQGSGFAGIGALVDEAGDDIYRAVDYGQGVAQFGSGFLIDGGGNNRFEGQLVCQGVGLTWGVGALLSAGVGHDHYYNKGKQGSGYQDDGSFSGWGQGLGVGHRPFASGGIGMLLDRGGDDDYEGGTFSLGGGYYFGLGIQRDLAGNDHYRGTRYNMGFTAHQAVGIFMDEAGDDDYLTTHFVAMGMSWDESCTLFLDRSGGDRYDAPGFAIGAAAMNGVAFFIDGDGSDVYIGNVRPGAVNGNSYHGGTSIGLALDLGSGTDDFNGKRERGEISAGDAHWFFVDAESMEVARRQLSQAPLSPEPAAE